MRKASNSYRRHTDSRNLEADARQSEDGEAYLQVSRTENCRFGVATRVEKNGEVTFSIEILINAMNMESPELLSELGSLMEIARKLKDKGYSLSHQDNGWILISKQVLPDAVNRELDEIAEMLCLDKKREDK